MITSFTATVITSVAVALDFRQKVQGCEEKHQQLAPKRVGHQMG